MFISDGFTLLGPEVTGRSARRRFSLQRFQVHHKFPTVDDLRGGGGLTKSAPVTDLPAPPDSSRGRWRMISPEVSTFDNRITVARLDRDIHEAFWESNKTEGVQLRAKAKLKGIPPIALNNQDGKDFFWRANSSGDIPRNFRAASFQPLNKA